KPSNNYQKKALRLLNKLKLIVKDLKGSTGYKLCQRNEICALIKRFSTPALFLTLNLSDINHPLVGVLGGLLPEQWQQMSLYNCSLFVAKNPAAAAQFFHVVMCTFFKVIVKHGSNSPGLCGHSEAYYSMMEAQGRGTLHCHMLLWLHGNPNPQVLRDQMCEDPAFEVQLFQ
ncbi:hypothetical protein SERLA73DRAFT_44077, partial [Serpula lacrymans var. lacrymans S7.3]